MTSLFPEHIANCAKDIVNIYQKYNKTLNPKERMLLQKQLIEKQNAIIGMIGYLQSADYSTHVGYSGRDYEGMLAGLKNYAATIYRNKNKVMFDYSVGLPYVDEGTHTFIKQGEKVNGQTSAIVDELGGMDATFVYDINNVQSVVSALNKAYKLGLHVDDTALDDAFIKVINFVKEKNRTDEKYEYSFYSALKNSNSELWNKLYSSDKVNIDKIFLRSDSNTSLNNFRNILNNRE